MRTDVLKTCFLLTPWQAEFEVTQLLKAGSNNIAVQVMRWSDGRCDSTPHIAAAST